MDDNRINVVVVATLTVTFIEKESRRKFIDKTTYGFVTSGFTKENQVEFTRQVQQGMDKKLKQYYGEETLKERFAKIDYKCSFRITEVDFIAITEEPNK